MAPSRGGVALLMLFVASTAASKVKFSPRNKFRISDARQRAVLAPFVVICTQRTGSQWVMKTLHKDTCDVDASPEIFMSDFAWNHTVQREALEVLFDTELALRPELESLPRQVVHDMHAARSYASPTAYGFKWMLNQGLVELWEWFTELCQARGIRLVFLHRLDYLRMYISYRHMHAVDIPHPANDADASKITNVKLKLPTGDDLVGKLVEYESRFRRMDELLADATTKGIPTMKVTYEHISANHSLFSDVQRFLTEDLKGETCVEAKREKKAKLDDDLTIRIHPDPPSAYVRNWPDVVDTLKDTKYARFVAR